MTNENISIGIKVDSSYFKGFQKIGEMESPEKQLTESCDILYNFNIPWWLAFGTALGFYRDGNFIYDDSDIDIGIMTDEKTTHAILKEFASLYNCFHLGEYNGKIHQAIFAADNGMIVDLSFYHEDKKRLYSYHTEGVWVDDRSYILKPRGFTTKHGILMFPKNIEKYLTARYGDWNIKQDKKSIINNL